MKYTSISGWLFTIIYDLHFAEARWSEGIEKKERSEYNVCQEILLFHA